MRSLTAAGEFTHLSPVSGKRKPFLFPGSAICFLSFRLFFFIFLSFRSFLALLPLLLCGYLLYLEHGSFGQVDSAFFRTNILIGFAVLFFTLAGIYLP